MKRIKGNAIIGQSGGPTSVINSSLAGVIEALKITDFTKSVLGMNYGIEGFLQERIFDLGKQPDSVIKGLRRTPSSALGSSRHKVNEEDLGIILKLLKKYDIRYLFLIGGNDTMDTLNKIERYCNNNHYKLSAVGIPKTVDNDLFGTDHTPGFASAAKSNILNVLQGGILARGMKRVDKFVIYQTIGREAGWLAASTALAKRREEEAPHLIYAPEFPFDKSVFLDNVEKCIKTYGWVSIVCGEGLRYRNGNPVSAATVKDKFNNIEFGAMGGASVGMKLHKMIRNEFGYRGEFQITESLIMSDFVRAVKLDMNEAYRCGKKAVRLAEKGLSGYMVTIERISDHPYKVKYGRIPLNDVAGKARPMPPEYFNEAGNFVSPLFMDYIKPLAGDIPKFIELEKIFVKK